MSNYLYESKRNYETSGYEPITLDQYMIFKDKTTNNKFLVLKFTNNTSYHINAISFEITQLNNNKQPIRKADYEYHHLEIAGNKSFVPFGKIKVDHNCEFIEAKIISVSSESQKWQNGQWEQLNVKHDNDVNHKSCKIETSIITKLTKKGFYFPYYLTIILILLFIAFCIVFMYYKKYV